MYPYQNEEDAVKDAVRLARGMTYKNAAVGLPFGGGKCVIIGDPKKDKTEGLLRVLARFIHRLGGLFLTGIDVGTTLQDMDSLVVSIASERWRRCPISTKPWAMSSLFQKNRVFRHIAPPMSWLAEQRIATMRQVKSRATWGQK